MAARQFLEYRFIPTCEPQARTDYERQLIFICVRKGKHKDVTNTPFIKIFRLPTQISILTSQTRLLCTGKRADVQSDFSLKGSPHRLPV